jgi:predicted O-methyltransferase YrrM
MNRLSKEYVTAKVLQVYLGLCIRPPGRLYGVPGYLHPLEGKFLFWLGNHVRPGGLALEVGSFKGKSAGFIAAGLPTGGRLACVDTWRNDAMPYDAPDDSFPAFQNNTARYRDSIETHRGSSCSVASGWKRPVDLLFIDGDHSYEGCGTDLQAWLPLVRPHGWVALHDFGEAGVMRAVGELFPISARYSELRVWSIFAARKR